MILTLVVIAYARRSMIALHHFQLPILPQVLLGISLVQGAWDPRLGGPDMRLQALNSHTYQNSSSNTSPTNINATLLTIDTITKS